MRLRILLTILLSLFLILVAGYFFKDRIVKGIEDFQQGLKNDNSEVTYYKRSSEVEGFFFEADYSDASSDNTWEYSITGDLPNPCYEAEVEARVAESFPEQVFITLTLTPPDSDTVCVQMIQEYVYDGTFQADKMASVKFNVVTADAD